MNQPKLKKLFQEVGNALEVLRIIDLMRERLDSKKGGQVRIIFENIDSYCIAQENQPFIEGQDMVVLGIKRSLNARKEKIKRQLSQLQNEINIAFQEKP